MTAARPSPLFYSTGEAAALLGLSPNKVRAIWREGRLQGEQFGRLLKLTRASVHSFAGEGPPLHEIPTGSPELRSHIREARRLHAELGRVLADLED